MHECIFPYQNNPEYVENPSRAKTRSRRLTGVLHRQADHTKTHKNMMRKVVSPGG